MRRKEAYKTRICFYMTGTIIAVWFLTDFILDSLLNYESTK